MNKLMNKLMILLIIYFDNITFLFNNKKDDLIKICPSLLGKWKLRHTNNKLFLTNSLVYIDVYSNNKIIIKSINSNGLIGMKTCSKFKIIDYTKKYFNKYNFKVQIYSHDLYSYSLLGIEIPKIKIKSKKKILNKYYTIKKKHNLLFIIEKNNITNLYYVFDIYSENNKLPHVEISIWTLISSQIISFIINLILINIFHYNIL